MRVDKSFLLSHLCSPPAVAAQALAKPVPSCENEQSPDGEPSAGADQPRLVAAPQLGVESHVFDLLSFCDVSIYVLKYVALSTLVRKSFVL